MIDVRRFGPERATPLISIVIPTISVRTHWLERAILSYEMNRPEACEIIVVHDRPTCGIAWNEGIAESTGRYIHLTADDIEAHPGWWEAAIARVRQGALPAPRILHTDGSLQSCGDADEMPEGAECEIARIPFASRAQFEKIGPMWEPQYYGDNWFSYRGRECGWPSLVTRDYLFTHHLAGEGRIDSLAKDFRTYRRRTGA